MQLLETLVSLNSHSLNPAGLKAVRKVLQEAFRALRAEQKVIGDNLVFTVRPKSKIQLFLGGHYDTVYPKDIPFKLQKISKKKWIGPGVADMKGGLVILLSALLELEKCPFRNEIGYKIVINSDEEIGSLASRSLIEKVSQSCLAAFFFEPALPDGRLVSRRKGSLSIALTSLGKGAHAGRDLHLGKNALIPLAAFMCRHKNKVGLNFAEIHGGKALNLVPDKATLNCNYRSYREKDVQRWLKTVQKSGLEWKILNERPPKPFDKATQKLIQLLDYGVDVCPTGGVCDGNFTAALKIPTVDTLGAIGGCLHTPEEYIELDSLHTRSELFARFLIRLAQGEISLPCTV